MEDSNDLYTYMVFLAMVAFVAVFAYLAVNINKEVDQDVVGEAFRADLPACCYINNMGRCVANNYRCHNSMLCELNYDPSCNFQIY